MRLLATILLLVLLALPAVAGDIELSAQKIEVNGLVGTIGLAGGVFWPVIVNPEYGVQLGPMLAIGTDTAVVGGGLKLPMSIEAPVLENLNFAWLGYGRNWVENTWGWEGGVGLVVEIQ